MSRVLHAGAAILSIAALSALGACSSSGESDGGKHKVSVETAVCSKDAKSVDVPSGFPSNFPLPSGTVVYSVDDRGSGGIVVTGVTATSFATVLKSLQTQLPAKGFAPDAGEVEAHDAESDWASTGYTGRWAIREIPQCSGDTLVNVVASKKTS